MEIGIAVFLGLLLLMALLVPSLGRGVSRGLKAGFYIVCLFGIMSWALTKGLVLAGLHRLKYA